MQELDPSRPVVGEDGLEYETLGHLLCGVPVKCVRNELVRLSSQHVGPKGSADWHLWRTAVWEHYQHKNRDGWLYSAKRGDLDKRTFPQGLEFFDPRDLPGYVGRPEGAGGTSPLQAAPDPVHAAD